MAIPTAADYQFAELENQAAVVLLTLRNVKRAQPQDRDRLARVLRERLQDFADAVLELAHQA